MEKNKQKVQHIHKQKQKNTTLFEQFQIPIVKSHSQNRYL